MDVPLSAAIAIVGMMMSIVGALIIVNLKSIKDCLRKLTGRIDKQDDRIDKCDEHVKGLAERQGVCKVDCERRFVTAEGFLRETGFQRREMGKLSEGLSRIEGKLTVTEQLPAICGKIASQVVKEMRNGDPDT